MTTSDLEHWLARIPQLGYYAVRQALLKRGASMADVAWVLIARLRMLAPGGQPS